MFVFGGHHSPKARLNDSWIFNTSEMAWEKVGNDPDNLENAASSIGAPAPRANMGSCIYDGKIFIQGGHGGMGYSRTAFNDIYSFDLAEKTWTKLESVSEKLPEGRGGHSLFANEGKLYIYGGWNSEMHFNNMWFYDFETREWTDNDLIVGMPRWNHCSTLVEAIPTWKFFIFGGEQHEYQEGVARCFGNCTNTSSYLDIGTMEWNEFASDPDVYDNIPSPREYSHMCYDNADRRLIVFGGWNNGW